MRYVYTVNNIGLENTVYFASKRAALNYAKRHNIRKLNNGHWGIVRTLSCIAVDVREDYRKLKERLDKQNRDCLMEEV
jgi:hypothetical protein